MAAITPAPVAEAGEARRLRSLLADADFTPDDIGRILRADGEVLGRTTELPVHLRRLADDPGPLATLVRLFVLCVPTPGPEAEHELGPRGVDALVRAGLLAVEGDAVPLARLVPHEDLLIASDVDRGDRADYVAGVHRPTATLAHLTVRDPVDAALDVGTGNGVQALLLARHARHVVATDVNERALGFAAFNAALNGIENIELRAGSFLEPVAGERFDLVVANPPYVVSPESEFLFRDGGLGRDRVSENLVRALPSVLAVGAYATVMVSWIIEGDEPAARARSWLEGSGCDALVLHSGTDDALTSAAVWNQDVRDPAEYAARVSRWADYYRDEDIVALGYGALVLRRREGANWVQALELPPGRVLPAHGHVRRLFAARDFLGAGPPLLERRFAFAPDAHLEQHARPGRDGWVGSEAALVLDEGLRFRAGLDANATRTVASISPGRPLRAILDDVAVQLGADRDSVRSSGVELVRRLLELGFLVPA